MDKLLKKILAIFQLQPASRKWQLPIIQLIKSHSSNVKTTCTAKLGNTTADTSFVFIDKFGLTSVWEKSIHIIMDFTTTNEWWSGHLRMANHWASDSVIFPSSLLLLHYTFSPILINRLMSNKISSLFDFSQSLLHGKVLWE